MIDDRPLSETDPIRAYTDDGANYITLAGRRQRRRRSIRYVTEQGFTGDATPQTLLYLYLRHALMLGYYDTSYRAAPGGGLPVGRRSCGDEARARVRARRRGEPAQREPLRRAATRPKPRITSSPTALVSRLHHGEPGYAARGGGPRRPARGAASYSPTRPPRSSSAPSPSTSTRAPTGSTPGCSGWSTSSSQTHALRPTEDVGGRAACTSARMPGSRTSGRRRHRLEPVAAARPTSQASFAGPTPLVTDPANGGYIHAPSLPHARTAAVLRSGYLANATPENPQTHGGQPVLRSRPPGALAARGHPQRPEPRCAARLSLRARPARRPRARSRSTSSSIRCARRSRWSRTRSRRPKTPPDVPIEAIEARNVLDGRKLIDQIKASGIDDLPVRASADAPDAIAGRGERDQRRRSTALLDVYDAIADLALAEGVHQAVQGNFERIAATLDAYTTGNFPPDPEVVQTPPTGIGLTHRVARAPRAGARRADRRDAARAPRSPAVDALARADAPGAGPDRVRRVLDRPGHRRRRRHGRSPSPTSACARSTCSTSSSRTTGQAHDASSTTASCAACWRAPDRARTPS